MKGLTPSTLSAQWSAIRALQNRADFSTISFLVTRLLRSFRQQKPIPPVIVPSWDLSLVLKGLQEPPFEPLSEADLLWLSAKTAFLVAIASAK